MTQHYLVRYTQHGEAALREAKRGEHIAYRKGLGGALVLAGPLLDDGNVPVGSVVIIAADTSAEARRIAESDPFVRAGLLDCITVEPMRIAAMKPPE
jgi:uncharacterized protein